MRIIPKAVEAAIEALSKLPGVGPRTAERLTFHLLKSDPAKAVAISTALSNLHANVRSCQICYNFSEGEVCGICESQDRQKAIIAVVEEPFDVVAIEKT